MPFQLYLKPMVCYKTWIKDYGEPLDHLVRIPATLTIVDEDYPLKDYGDQLSWEKFLSPIEYSDFKELLDNEENFMEIDLRDPEF